MPAAHQLLEQALRLHQTGQLDQAAALYRELLTSEPNQPDALHLLGRVLQHRGDHNSAVEHFSRAIQANGAAAAYRVSMANSLRALGRDEEAIVVYQAALALEAGNAEAYHQLGNALKRLHRFSEAVPNLRRAAELSPADAAIQLNLGAALLELSQREEAIACFRRAIELQPGRAEAHNILGSALLSAGQLSAAREELEAALRLRSAYPAAHDNLGRVFRAQGQPEQAVAEFRAALAGQASPGTHSNLVYALNFVPGLAPEEAFAEHRRWAERHASTYTAQVSNTPKNTGASVRCLRIGYVSPDFVHHAVSYFIEPVLAAHDRKQVEVFCYSNALVTDYVTERLRALSDGWRDIARLSDDEAEALIREDKIDLLVDLAGHTARHRLPLFARRPAPVQLTWLGYPNTTGLSAIDYRITDAVCDPVGATEALHTERLLRLPENFSCYRPPDEAPAVNTLPALTNGYVTFGSFNHFAKVNASVLACWATLLERVPRARLFIKARSLADAPTRARVQEFFASRGIAEDRLELRSEELSVSAHLAQYHHVDIALDTFPYNGTTTTCEALWMGVPVVTLAGRTHVSRVSASLLTHLGCEAWIANSENSYIEKCTTLAENPNSLASIRGTLRERMRVSPLCDAPRFTQNLEAAYRLVWNRHVSP